MKVVTEPLAGGSALARDYMNRYETVEHLYGGDFRNEGSRALRAEWLDSREALRADRAQVAACLRSYNEAHNPHEAVKSSLALLEQPGTLVISGGQQSGLFTGPLLVIYKAMTTIIAAKEAGEQLGRPVVPLFWIAGEDHDWDEVNHTYVLNRNGEISKIKIEKTGDVRSSVSDIKVEDESWQQVVAQLDELLQDSEFKPGIMEFIREASSASNNMTDLFAKLMGNLFGKFGLILLDSADPCLRKLEQPFFETLIRENEELETAYLNAAAVIRDSGYQLQADVAEGSANLFYIHEGTRLLLHKKDGFFTDRKGTISFSKEALLDILYTHPERFSNNVLTRPLMQDYLLPTLATVLGQGEIAYWAIPHQAFKTVGGAMPLIIPRMSFTLVEGTLQKHMDKYGIGFPDVHQGLDGKRQEWLTAQDELRLGARFEETKAAFNALYEPLIEQLGTIQAGLLKLGSNNKDKILDQISFLQAKAQDAVEKQNEAALRQWERIELSLMPQGKLQERVYNIMYYLNRYGPDWLDNLMAVPADYSGNHRMIYM
ncbi:bacillithiol biosynthesis cysteine-adding enzyme BshC [Bacillus sp. FJAT-27264]|uniref:bacillithiol biosynthesis cysteine-adding enzyme BshC n=1 Tax=Paenibacillus sp. (strain DSM 101736 / FJAT-27264) TaxID=1850362 RepID=UPI000807CC8D|nr:bacillithiol biosynthesis cysteine-adding enzyme BshC [Bacillus sp. FJAT-27264]OBZ19113.1 bacillithiol biosynthesis cysteine-adding enzyme BshC [Bacillus sp. FJAT-27264]